MARNTVRGRRWFQIVLVVVIVVTASRGHSILCVGPRLDIIEVHGHLIDQMDFDVVLQFMDYIPDLRPKRERD